MFYLRIIWDWILINKEWFLSGLGVTIILSIRSYIYFVFLKYFKKPYKSTGLRIVDVMVSDKIKPLIEFKLRNIGDDVCFIKEANIKVLRIARLRNPYQSQYILVHNSKNYDINFDGHKFIKIKMSQALSKNEVDCFSFTFMEENKGDPFIPSIFYVVIELKFNENNQKIMSEPLLFLVNNNKANGITINTTNEDHFLINYNKYLIKKFNELKAIKSESFLTLYQTVIIHNKPFSTFLRNYYS